ncbi:hypothetical protein GCM10018781_78550 [Kitasatospora indigofera]|uniref:Aminoglycoside phosphotransferase domain-containing protein n=1 Tax=Kitasatospora indigofera TaxID=67307 RepID=A0A919D800_9ACTN|nr:phosphotransferase [Kitasatospora indigofera]GHE26393.1 hypothetical protein GCM10018781_78550 [Kitasatospora indigofera]
MATYTTLDDLDVPALCSAYGLHDPRLQPLKGGAANSSFQLRTAEGCFVLTVLDNHDPTSAAALADHTRVLFAHGLPTAEVVPEVGGGSTTVIGGKPVLLKRWIEGEVIDPLPEDRLTEAGALLARLHNLPADLTEVPVASRRLSADQQGLIGGFRDRAFAAWLSEQLTVVNEREAGRQRSAVLCHGDLFADNLICRAGGSLAVIDWETISLDDPLLDLGMAAVGLAQQAGRLHPRRLELLVEGYTGVRPLPQEVLDELPMEIVHAALIIAFHRYYRHNVRFPNADRADFHLRMVDFAASVRGLA